MEMVSSIPSLCKKRGSASHLSLNPCKKLAHVPHSVVYNLSTKFGNQSKPIDPFTAPTTFQLGTPEMIGSKPENDETVVQNMDACPAQKSSEGPSVIPSPSQDLPEYPA
jgi:hypothetical protein